MFRIYNPNLRQRTKELRKRMTPQEKHLWYDYLSKYLVKFYRQRNFGSYVTDFYCDKARLVVELDGSEHYTSEHIEYDRIREQYLNSIGIKVVRFSNVEVDGNFEGVCYVIDKAVNDLMSGATHPAATEFRKAAPLPR